MVNLVVACGGGIFTTTIVSDEIKQILKKNKIKFNLTPAKLTEIAGINGVDLIVVTGKFGTDIKNGENIPIISGMPLFTGKGKNEFIENFLSMVKKIEEAK